eukprot:TRINITY_DN1163_c0_g1_i1.p2 TRINITY_DN1163_c0_g1~~TRINITY_DN1163_c0_g1_i1.p2  ORF type:complete len:274 (-),score=55.51 TRINITY_DN1163_c0_g1_i1:1133-1906(-)
MGSHNFGAAFVLRGVPELNKKSKRGDVIEGVFQVDIGGRAFHFIRKCAIIYSIGWAELHDARTDGANTYCINLLFKSAAPAEVHAQSEEERKALDQIMSCIIKGQPVSSDVLSKSDHVMKRGWCKKQGKMMGDKRMIQVTRRGALTVYKEDDGKALPSYIILLHHKTIILPVKDKSISLTGSFKSIVFTFSDMEEREAWLNEMKTARLPPPKIEGPASPTSIEFQRHHSYMPDDGRKVYLKQIVHKGVAPAGPSGHW